MKKTPGGEKLKYPAHHIIYLAGKEGKMIIDPKELDKPKYHKKIGSFLILLVIVTVIYYLIDKLILYLR